MVNNKHRQRNAAPRSKAVQLTIDYSYIILGSIIVGLAFRLFLFPNEIASGGVSGISTITGHLFGIEPAITQWVLNIPLFIAGVIFLGKQFGVKTLVGTILLPFVVYLSRNMEPITTEPLLAALFGGIGIGLGLGLVFRGKASTGGTDLAAQIIHKYTGLSLGVAVLILDGLVVTASAFAFNIEFALYALISLYVTSKTIDLVQVGLGYAKVAYIISNEAEKISQALLNDLDRGMTKLKATGGYTEDERPVLMCVVHQMEISKLKHLVKLHDPNAFVIVHNANEVLGEGFKKEA
ncbi:YitT family protein [Bacillus horti]|uniref:Uncharacterized membrane-anchored protein YitT (DUF2179 family) n=1 Tax=Caldalkalibacillus horti TaxID=77523 RepID=A0ABT9VZC0_9BACI|nr:YitT family protein [Bacillus horti]MDQ0166323.1 uncharacterized membrane-anchored protein YitT (DUF2179 family) [Bacillus horti]